jgi:hypothetical protein
MIITMRVEKFYTEKEGEKPVYYELRVMLGARWTDAQTLGFIKRVSAEEEIDELFKNLRKEYSYFNLIEGDNESWTAHKNLVSERFEVTMPSHLVIITPTLLEILESMGKWGDPKFNEFERIFYGKPYNAAIDLPTRLKKKDS